MRPSQKMQEKLDDINFIIACLKSNAYSISELRALFNNDILERCIDIIKIEKKDKRDIPMPNVVKQYDNFKNKRKHPEKDVFPNSDDDFVMIRQRIPGGKSVMVDSPKPDPKRVKK